MLTVHLLAALAACQATHTAAPGDTLTSVSEFYFGGGGYANAILQSTNARVGAGYTAIENAFSLPARARLCIPDVAEANRNRLLFEAYQRAIRETMLPEPSEVSTSLVSINPSAPVHVTSWISAKILGIYKTDGKWVTAAPENIWVSVDPQARDFCRKFTKAHGTDPGQLTLRLEQYFGLPPGAGNVAFIEITVADPSSTANIFRPCAASPATHTSTCPVGPPPTSDPKHAAWIYEWYYTAFSQAMPYQYPWTGLGYSFDWARRENGPGFVRFGPSEFVIPKGAPIRVTGAVETAKYCAP